MEFEALSNSFWFIVSAYIAAFLPWTAIAATDFISSKWVSVRRTRTAGYRNLLWTVFPMAYVMFYSVVQGKAEDYSEMCAAVVASAFAGLIAARTVWGLWQLHEFHQWATRSIEALRCMGIEYEPVRLKRMEEQCGVSFSEMRSEDIADEIAVNEKIVDNQIMHGDVQCYVKFGDMVALKGEEGIRPPTVKNRVLRIVCDIVIATMEPFGMGVKWVLIPFAIVLECFLVTVGKRREKRLRQVPKTPSEVWVHWAAAFASQGLQKWMFEFEVAHDPNENKDADSSRRENGMENLKKRCEYFGAELLGSAAMHVWWENGGRGRERGSNPMLWTTWKEGSEMRDGRVVKEELLKDAMESGECLPFGAEDVKWRRREVEGDKMRYGYDEYKEVLAEFMSELPVRCSYVREMRKFDVNMLEWLTIILHLGGMSLGMEREWGSGRGTGRGWGRGKSKDTENPKGRERNRSMLKRGACESGTHEVVIAENEGDFRTGEEAVNVLCSQLGLERRKVEREWKDQGHYGFRMEGRVPVSNIPIMKEAIRVVSDGNRLVCKVGEVVDIWMSLLCGDHLEFLVEDLNEEWVKMCLGQTEGEISGKGEDGEGDEGESKLNLSDMREVHKEVEKRRLRGRLANKKGSRYGYVEEYVTFMGYRMESVRTVMGRWVERNEGKCGNDMFSSVNWEEMEKVKIEVELSEDVMFCLGECGVDGNVSGVGGRGVQSRLVWELQNILEKKLLFEGERFEEEEKKMEMRVSTIMLLLLSFPGLRVRFRKCEAGDVVEENGEWCSINVGCNSWGECCYGIAKCEEEHKIGERNEVLRVMSRSNELKRVEICVVCGPQRMGVRVELRRRNQCELTVLNEGREKFKWKWWRDAFIGRLEGMEEWQKGIGVNGVEVERWGASNGESDGVIREVWSLSKKKIQTWSEWGPFRMGFCRFELESKGLLEQPIRGGRRRAQFKGRHTFVPVRLAMLKVINVSYNEIEDGMLRHYCDITREALECGSLHGRIDRCNDANKLEEGNVNGAFVKGGPEDVECHGRRVLAHHRVAALKNGSVDGLRKYLRITCAPGREKEHVSEGLELLHGFVEGMLLSGKNVVRMKEGTETQMREIILPECVKLMDVVERNEGHEELLLPVLLTCAAADPDEHWETVMRLMQRMISMSNGTEAELVCQNYICQVMYCMGSHGLEEIFLGSTKEHIRTYAHILEILINCVDYSASSNNERSSKTRRGGKWWRNEGKGGPTYHRMDFASSRDGSLKFRVKLSAEAMGDLGHMLHYGTEGAVDRIRALELYEQAIAVGGYTDAMTCLAHLLEEAVDGMSKDVARAIQLYDRAIKEGNDTFAMCNLADLLLREDGVELARNRGEGVAANTARAVELYERAIDEGYDTDAMYQLAKLLEDGCEDVEANTARAMELYQRAIDEGNDAGAMNNLAMILWKGRGDAEMDVKSAVQLFERAIEEGNVAAMYNLGKLLEQGADEVEKDVRRAADLYQRAVDKGNVTYAMYQLGRMLEGGCEDVAVNTARAVELYHRAIKEGNVVDAMNAVVWLLLRDVDGIPTGIARTVEIVRDGVEENNDVNGMVALSVLYARSCWSASGADMEASRTMMRRAVRKGEQLGIDHGLVVRVWRGVRDGVDGFEKDAQFANEIETHCEQWGIVLEDEMHVGTSGTA
eukprot:TRINITY_DN164_c0_g1_i11.p1 TRINITY_DN164_c0_g1~~TRINITY_DN164_c0_g1_i11.p1  ORF type:complete len:1662 (-),score=296.66 TRINITY_DN164_c0_g1_i11:8067-13052(-)